MEIFILAAILIAALATVDLPDRKKTDEKAINDRT